MALSVAKARAEVADLSRASDAEVRAIFDAMTAATAEEIRDHLIDVLPEIGADYQLAAASLAADWYDDLREAAEVRGRFSAIVAPLATDERWRKLAAWGVDPLFRPEPDVAAAVALIQGGVQRTMANAHRNTIIGSSLEDPRAAGWARYGNGDTCTFCRLLIGRGAVYTDKTASFGAHDNCHCVAGPEFGSAREVDGYLTSTRRRSDTTKASDAARARAWMSANL